MIERRHLFYHSGNLHVECFLPNLGMDLRDVGVLTLPLTSEACQVPLGHFCESWCGESWILDHCPEPNAAFSGIRVGCNILYIMMYALVMYAFFEMFEWMDISQAIYLLISTRSPFTRRYCSPSSSNRLSFGGVLIFMSTFSKGNTWSPQTIELLLFVETSDITNGPVMFRRQWWTLPATTKPSPFCICHLTGPIGPRADSLGGKSPDSMREII